MKTAYIIQLMTVQEDGTAQLLQWSVCPHKLGALTDICKITLGEPVTLGEPQVPHPSPRPRQTLDR